MLFNVRTYLEYPIVSGLKFIKPYFTAKCVKYVKKDGVFIESGNPQIQKYATSVEIGNDILTTLKSKGNVSPCEIVDYPT